MIVQSPLQLPNDDQTNIYLCNYRMLNTLK